MEKYIYASFEVINHHEVPLFLALGILLFALVAWIVFRVRIRPIKRDLKKAIAAINATSEIESEFYEQFEELNEKLRDNKLLKHSWSEFTETLIISDETATIRNSRESHIYFNLRNLTSDKINISFFQAFPNKLVGIGLLFTFIGLIAALYFASKGVTSPDIEVAKHELQKLLNAATFKFSTSIAGLLGSLFFSWGEKHTFHSISRQIHQICKMLDERLEFVTPEKLANEQLQQAIIQTEQLERFNTDLAVSIAGALKDPIADAFELKLQPLIEKIDNLASNIGGMNQTALEEMISKFGDRLNESAGKEMESLGATLNNLVDAIKDVTADMRSSMKEITDTLGAQILNLGGTMSTGANEFKDRMQGSADNINATIHTLNNAVDQFSSNIDALNTVSDQFRGMIGQISTLSSQFDEPIRNIKEASMPLNNIASGITNLIGSIVESQQTADASMHELKDTASNMSETSHHVMTTLDSYKNNFETVDKSVTHVFEEINRGLDAYTKNIQSFVSEIDGSFTDAVKILSGAIEELREAIEEMDDNK